MDLSFYATRIAEEVQSAMAAVREAAYAVTETARAQRAPHILQQTTVRKWIEVKPHPHPAASTSIWYCWTGTLAHQQGAFQHCTGVYGTGATPAEACAAFDKAWSNG